MTTQLDDDICLSIQLLSFDRPSEQVELFYFLEMSTLQATTLLPLANKIVKCEIVAYTKENEYLDKSVTEKLKSIGDFNNLFITKPEYYIHNCFIELEDGINISSHDDGEVSIEFIKNSEGHTLIDRIFEKYKLDKKLIDELKKKPGHYIAIDKSNNITGDFKDFDEYVENGLN